ncbi:MAG: DHHA1 domain-containing protein, partial [Eubacterium sp.]
QEYIECAAIATVADIVPLVSENRIIAALGIDYLNNNPMNLGIRSLIEVSELKKINAGNIGFVIAPKINAAGRLGEADKVVELYLTEDPAKAGEIASYLSLENRKRQDIEMEILELAKAQVEKENLDNQGIMVVAGEGWHPGVIGIVASRLQEIWYHPTIVIGIDEEGVGKGSCRSVEGFNIFEALQSCAELFSTYGGHEQAAGFSLVSTNIPEMTQKINQYAKEKALHKLLNKTLYYDGIMPLEEVSEGLIEELEHFEPFGVGNPGPVFMVEGVAPQSAKRMGGDGSHLMFTLPPYRCVGFGMGDLMDEGIEGQFSILCKPEINCFNNKKSVQLLL